MKNRIILSVVLAALFFCSACSGPKTEVLVIGGSASGVAAGIQSARLGAKTIILEEHLWLGGMLTSAGVSAVDGNYRMPAGIFGEFRDSLVAHYGSLGALATGWVSNVLFEPSVGARIYKNMAAREPNLTVQYETKFISAEKTATGWKVVADHNGKQEVFEADILIDATELGDVAKACGVKYDIGIEDRNISGEAWAGDKNCDIIQDLTYAMILKDYGPEADMTIERPENYDPSLFYCSCKSQNCTDSVLKPWDFDMVMRYGKLPNNKYMINWPMQGNDYYTNIIEMDEKGREAELKKAKHRSLCYLYYMQHELGSKNLGLADDEYPTEDLLPFIPYHRESRRIQGVVRFNVNQILRPYDYTLYRTGIAVGDYPVDHHHQAYPNQEELKSLTFGPVPSYNVPMGVLLPKEVTDLIVAEKSVSVSNIVNGCTRLQPVVTQLGQAAGILAALAVKENRELREVTVREVQKVLLENGGYLMPYIDLPKDHPHFKALQRIGVCGILKGEGRSINWANETWFRKDEPVGVSELSQGLADLYPTFKMEASGEYLSVEETENLLVALGVFLEKEGITAEHIRKAWGDLGLRDYKPNRPVSREEFAVLFDHFLTPFDMIRVDINGMPV